MVGGGGGGGEEREGKAKLSNIPKSFDDDGRYTCYQQQFWVYASLSNEAILI